MIFQISGTIRIFDNVPFYMKKIGTTISGESRKSEPRFRENQENSIRPKQAQSQMCKLIITYLMMLSYVFIVIEIY